MNETPGLTKRRLQAQVIGPIYEEMVRQLGEEKPAEILDTAIRDRRRAVLRQEGAGRPDLDARLHQRL
jgi:hypothetical protein